MKCEGCKEEYEVYKLCPECWDKLLKQNIGSANDNWLCLACGNEMSIKAQNTEESIQVLAVICTHCKNVYYPI